MKRFTNRSVFLLLVLMISCLAGCSVIYNKPETDSGTTYMDPVDATEIVLQAIQDQDVESIHKIFCPYIQENDPELDDKIEGMFQYIDGNIIDYDEPGRMPGSLGPDIDGNRVKTQSAESMTVKTDRDANYQIRVGLVKEYENKPDYIGVTSIMVFNKDKMIYDKTKGGYPEDAIYRVEYERTFEDY
ncbi:MAG: DUF5104 domain-containing protein [Eubacteriales bacterium]|nr:DUF5104 domain-containing protein [Eubacteriales bacterium]